MDKLASFFDRLRVILSKNRGSNMPWCEYSLAIENFAFQNKKSCIRCDKCKTTYQLQLSPMATWRCVEDKREREMDEINSGATTQEGEHVCSLKRAKARYQAAYEQLIFWCTKSYGQQDFLKSKILFNLINTKFWCTYVSAPKY